ncbi:30S ribosomal protein S20 [Selenomonadales bacterium OttesenSCG-928-I06]|nr:30S ribosomal protein S20 [Selenomonadales bacterium OttesenSCG-928-I06]
MPNIKSSIRSVKTDAKRRARNFAVRSNLRTASRKVEEAIQAGNYDEAKIVFNKAASVIDKAVSKGVIHKNAAARKKSSLAAKTNALANNN